MHKEVIRTMVKSAQAPFSFYKNNMKNSKSWFCIKYLIHEAWIGEDWRKFENWEDAERYAELMYGVNLWSITSNNQ